MNYNEYFKNYTIEQKRADLICNPLFDHDAIAQVTDNEIKEIHKWYFESMNQSCVEIMGESIFDELD